MLFIDLQTNVLGVCVVNREYMKQMKERGVDDGHMIIINRSVNCVFEI